MQLRDLFIISKGTKVIFLITFSVSLTAVLFALFYYQSINSAEDPRIAVAKNLLLEYEKAQGGINSIEAFPILDSAFAIFRSLPDYSGSFEIGVIYNNKCSALLLPAIYDTTISESEKNNLLALSMSYCDSSINCYNNWKKEWNGLSASDTESKLRTLISEKDPGFEDVNFNKVFKKRVKGIMEAQVETDRRLSVSITNKGIIFRHMQKPDSALICYREALNLWEHNRIAKSNLSVLMGGQPVKPSLLESLFPPDKRKR
jgi:tetratricopeptide (TPR) repeat protein